MNTGRTRFTSERAREVALAREARRREARHLAAERGEVAESASQPSRIADVSDAPRIVYPGTLVIEGQVIEVEGRLEVLGAPRSLPGPEQASGQQGVPPRSPQPGPQAARVVPPSDRPSDEEIAARIAEQVGVTLDQAADEGLEGKLDQIRRHVERGWKHGDATPKGLTAPYVGGVCQGHGGFVPAHLRLDHACDRFYFVKQGQPVCSIWSLGYGDQGPLARPAEVCPKCGASWPAGDKDARARHVVERAWYRGMSEAEDKNRAICRNWAAGHEVCRCGREIRWVGRDLDRRARCECER